MAGTKQDVAEQRQYHLDLSDAIATARAPGLGDNSPEMIAKARGNIVKTDLRNVEFRLGEIEHLPVADESVDVIRVGGVQDLEPFCNRNQEAM